MRQENPSKQLQTNRINKTDFVQKLIEKGYNEAKAKQVYDDFLDVFQDSLLNKQSVLLTGIGVIDPVYTPKQQKKLFGELQECGDSLSLSIKTSRAFSKTFKKEHSNRGNIDKKVGQVGSLFRK